MALGITSFMPHATQVMEVFSTGDLCNSFSIFDLRILGPKILSLIIALKIQIFQNIIIFFQNLDQDLSFEGSNFFIETLEVWFLALWTWAFFSKLQISPFCSKLVDLRVGPKSDNFFQTVEKSTFCYPTKKFDPSKESS